MTNVRPLNLRTVEQHAESPKISCRSSRRLHVTNDVRTYRSPRQHIWERWSEVKRTQEMIETSRAMHKPSPLEEYLSTSTEIDYQECGRKIAETMRTSTEKQTSTSARSHLDIVRYLKLVEQIWIKASETADGLDHDAFIDFLSPMLNVDRGTLSILFHKMDANSDGSLSWDEYLSYLHREIKHSWKFRVAKGTHHLQQAKNRSCDIGASVRSILVIPADSVAQSPGKYVLSCSDDTVQVWDSSTLTRMVYLPLHMAAAKLREKAFNHEPPIVSDGSHQVSDEASNHQLTLGSRPTNQKSTALYSTYRRDHAVPHTCTTYYHNQRQIFVASMERVISVFGPMHNEYFLVDAWKAKHTARCMAIGFIPNVGHDCLIIGGTEGYITVYNLANRSMISEFMAHDGQTVRRVQFIADIGLISSGMDGTVAIWDIERWTCSNRLVGHTRGVYSFSFCKDNKCMFSGGYDKDVLVWNRFQNKPTEQINNLQSGLLEVIGNEDKNQVITVCSDKKIKVFDIRTLTCLQSLVDLEQSPGDRLTAAAFDHENQQLVVAGDHLRVFKVVVAPENLDRQFGSAHTSLVVAVCYSTTFKVLLSVTIEGSVSLWNVETGENTFGFHTQHQTPITAATLGPREKRLFTTAVNEPIMIWNFNNGACLCKLSTLKSEVSQILCLPRTVNSVVALSRETHINRYPDPSAPKNTDVLTQRVRCGEPSCGAVHHSSFATGTTAGEVVIWFTESTSEKRRFSVPQANAKVSIDQDLALLDTSAPVLSSVVSHLVYATMNNVVYLLVGMDSGSVHLYQDGTYELLYTWEQVFKDSVQGICVDGDGTRMLLCDSRQKAVIYDVSNISPQHPDNSLLVRTFQLFDRASFTSVTFIHQCRCFCVASDCGDMALWTTSGQQVAVFGATKPWPLRTEEDDDENARTHTDDDDVPVKCPYEEQHPAYKPATLQKMGLRVASFSLSFLKEGEQRHRSRLINVGHRKQKNNNDSQQSREKPSKTRSGDEHLLTRKLDRLDQQLLASWSNHPTKMNTKAGLRRHKTFRRRTTNLLRPTRHNSNHTSGSFSVAPPPLSPRVRA